MSAETPNPQPRDRVKVSYVTEYTDDGSILPMGRLVEDVTVEVLERADDPTLDPIWTVREVEPKPPAAMSNVVVKFGDSFWLYPSNMGNGYGRLDWANVRESKVVGAVPGTAAARFEDAITDLVSDEPAHRSVRVPNEPHGVSVEARRLMVDLVAVDRPDAAVNVAATAGMDRAAARAYVMDLMGGGNRTEVDPTEGDRMREMGFDKQPEFQVSDEDRALIQSVLDERANEYVYGGANGWKLDSAELTGVVADIVWAVIKRDRDRGGSRG